MTFSIFNPYTTSIVHISKQACVTCSLFCWSATHIGTHPDSSNRLQGSSCNAVPLWLLRVGVPLRVLCTAVTGTTPHSVAAEDPHSTLKGTPTCST